MKRLDQYILRQLFTPLIMATAVVTAIVWLTQSLQRLDLIIEYGEGWRTFGWLTVLIVPNLLGVVLPFALFGAVLFALHRFHTDSEIAVMFASGVSRMRLSAPILVIASLVAGLAFYINLDLSPRAYRTLKQEIADIRADFASAVLRSGEFTQFSDGFTIYVEEALGGGWFRGMLINDYRDGGKAETYMAQRGRLTETSLGPVLILSRGNVQTVDKETGDVDIVQFTSTSINVSGFSNNARTLQLELTERYLGELLEPDMTSTWDRENAGKLIAEGHNRLASPLYVFAFALIAIFALTGGAYNRRGYGWRIALACVAAGGMKIAAYLIQALAADTGAFWLIYTLPGVAIVSLLVVLSDLRLPVLIPTHTDRAPAGG